MQLKCLFTDYTACLLYTSLSASRLDPRACMVVSNGAYKEYGMMEGLDDTFDGVCFVGYHCRSNTRGVMAHTIWGTLVRSIRVDGEEMGESGINARLAWEYGCLLYTSRCV